MTLGDRIAVLRDGAARAGRHPERGVAPPATVAVARLVGDLPLTVLAAAAVGESGDHVVAVRAADLRLCPPGEGVLDVVVADVVLDGGSAVARCASAQGPVHVRVPWGDRPVAGRRHGVVWEAGREHRFDARTGARLP